MNLTYKPKMEIRDVSLIREYFFCERMHAKIPKATCVARQAALVQDSRRFLFPECGNCSQGKIIAKEQQNVNGDKKDETIMEEEIIPGEKTGEGKGKTLPEPPPKTDMAVVQVDFGDYAQIFEGVKKMAEEEIRPVELQIIYLLKSYLGRLN